MLLKELLKEQVLFLVMVIRSGVGAASTTSEQTAESVTFGRVVGRLCFPSIMLWRIPKKT